MRRPRHATIVAYLALFVALGGSSYAAITLKRGSVKGKHIAKNAITGPKVKNRSLRAGDFAPGQLPRGERGEPGPRGDTGPAGAPNPNAANSEQLDGIDSSEFLRGRGRSFSDGFSIAPNDTEDLIYLPTETFHFGLQYACPAGDPSASPGTVIFLNRLNTTVNVFYDNGSASPGYVEVAANGASTSRPRTRTTGSTFTSSSARPSTARRSRSPSSTGPSTAWSTRRSCSRARLRARTRAGACRDS